MGKPLRDSKGRYAGSTGNGSVPSSVSARDRAVMQTRPGASREATTPAETDAYAGYAAARAARHGRQFVVGTSVDSVKAKVDGRHTHMAVTLRYPAGTNVEEVVSRLRVPGRTLTTSDYPSGKAADEWSVSTDQTTGMLEVSSPLLKNDTNGWKAAEAAERAVRGRWFRRGVRPASVTAEVGSSPTGA